jgi:hypothetical protein
MVLGLLKNSINTPIMGMPLLDRTMGGGTAFFVILSPFVTLAPRGRNKKYHTRKKTMAKPCRIMVVDVFLQSTRANFRPLLRVRRCLCGKPTTRKMRPMQSGTTRISFMTSRSGLKESGTSSARFGFGFLRGRRRGIVLPSSTDFSQRRPTTLFFFFRAKRTTKQRHQETRAPSSSYRRRSTTKRKKEHLL